MSTNPYFFYRLGLCCLERELQDKIVDLEKEKEVLETDILKLKDPDYIAKYVREKYFYSKDGELILKIDE